MAMIAADLLDAGGESLETVVAHEVAHQWWYAVVGSDPVNQAWQDEALSQFSMLEYLEDRHALRGAKSTSSGSWRARCASRCRGALRGCAAGPVFQHVRICLGGL